MLEYGWSQEAPAKVWVYIHTLRMIQERKTKMTSISSSRTKYDKSKQPVKNKLAELITEIQEQRNRWVEQFEKVLGGPATLKPLAIKRHTQNFLQSLPYYQWKKSVRPSNKSKVGKQHTI